MVRTQFSNYEDVSRPAWAGDFRSRDHLVPGPAHLEAAAFPLDDNGIRSVPDGTVVGRTNEEEEAGTGFGPVAVDGTTGETTDDQIYIVAFPVADADDIAECELYRPNSLVKINFLPEVMAGTLSAAVEAAVRERYICQRGAD